jgi:hypothetical protein
MGSGELLRTRRVTTRYSKSNTFPKQHLRRSMRTVTRWPNKSQSASTRKSPAIKSEGGPSRYRRKPSEPSCSDMILHELMLRYRRSRVPRRTELLFRYQKSRLFCIRKIPGRTRQSHIKLVISTIRQHPNRAASRLQVATSRPGLHCSTAKLRTADASPCSTSLVVATDLPLLAAVEAHSQGCRDRCNGEEKSGNSRSDRFVVQRPHH